jgi:hypothetical protein
MIFFGIDKTGGIAQRVKRILLLFIFLFFYLGGTLDVIRGTKGRSFGTYSRIWIIFR